MNTVRQGNTAQTRTWACNTDSAAAAGSSDDDDIGAIRGDHEPTGAVRVDQFRRRDIPVQPAAGGRDYDGIPGVQQPHVSGILQDSGRRA